MLAATALGVQGQKTEWVWSPQQEKLLLPGTDSVLIDSLPVQLSSVRLQSTRGEEIPYVYRVEGKTYRYITFAKPIEDTLVLTYKRVPLNLNQRFRNKDTTLLIPEITRMQNSTLYESDEKSAFKPFEGLNSKGSISRSITVGNNQDAVLNSSLNLQLAGNLGKNTEIRATITDNNIPVQSDGYTQQLREFDRVYIELENSDFGLLRAGDYNMTSTSNHFLQFDKRISGAGVFTAVPIGDEAKIPITAQGGIARGKFARNRFMGQEGNQGPYKLVGANGERFVIIISGSERVYIDGVVMKRGQQNDYVMDYNAGELTFTSLRPITKESRIVVEFQYTEQNYLRSVAFGSTGFENDRFKTSVQFYTEQDSKNQPLNQELSDNEKQILSKVGDRLDDALVSTIRPSEFRDDIVLYRLTDSLGFDSVLVYSIDSTLPLYQASFAYLGTNRGHYVQAQNNANGRVFRWVPPVNGVPQGSYQPVKQLVAPNQLQILTAETEALIGENQKLRVDLATSKNDINLFSDLDEGNDIGAAGKISYHLKGELGKANWFTNLRYEFNQENFRTIERIRNVEFARDWNLPLNFNGAVQLAGTTLGIKGDSSQLAYDVDHLSFNGYSGLRHTLSGNLRTTEDVGEFAASWLNSNDSLGQSDFLREKGIFTHYLTPVYWIGMSSVGESNRRVRNGTDTLRMGSYQFLEYRLFTGVGDTAESFAELFFLKRYDDTAVDGRFKNFSVVNAYGLRSSLLTNFNSRLELFGNIRNLKVFLPEEKTIERTVTSRATYTQRLWGNAITSTTFYETGSGTEPRRSFSYVEVPAGTGTYTHTDYNGNGIKELDEFEIAPTPDRARYVRVFTPSTEFVRTNLNKFGENLNINAPTDWKQKEDLRKTLARFSVLFNYQLDRKTLLTGSTNTLNPFSAIENDTQIVALNNVFRNTVFFNRTATKFGMDYTYRTNDSRNLLSFGVERRSIVENNVGLRYQLSGALLFRTQVALINKENTSGNFTRRNFTIDEVGNEYSLAYQPADKFVITGKYNWSNQDGSTSEETVALNNQDFGLELSYNLAETLSMLVQGNYILNSFTGNSNNPAAFEMLEGLRPGENGTWNLTLQRTIRKNLLISLNYNGRISEGTLPVHLGSLQVKAFF
ncbi:MAG: hypothetical protein CMI35_13825 [Owenweeksia sp.]|nr:hypothetical protein [Owenweeksia sp.]